MTRPARVSFPVGMSPPPEPAPQRQLAPWRASYVRFCSKPTVLALAAAVLIAIRVVDCSGQPAEPERVPVSLLTTGGIESQIRVGITVQLGSRDTRVESVTCTRGSGSHATCEAEMSGEGAGRYEIDALIDPDVGLVEWHVVGRLPAQR
jgi:hypothetical protein